MHPTAIRFPALVLARLLVLSVALTWGQALSASDATPPGAKAKPAYELPTTGKNIPRDGGGWINGSVSGVQLVLTFFDADKKPVPPDRSNGFAQFRKPGTDIRTPLYRKDNALIATELLRPPYVFFVSLDLFDEGSDKPVEKYSFEYP